LKVDPKTWFARRPIIRAKPRLKTAYDAAQRPFCLVACQNSLAMGTDLLDRIAGKLVDAEKGKLPLKIDKFTPRQGLAAC